MASRIVNRQSLVEEAAQVSPEEEKEVVSELDRLDELIKAWGSSRATVQTERAARDAVNAYITSHSGKPDLSDEMRRIWNNAMSGRAST